MAPLTGRVGLRRARPRQMLAARRPDDKDGFLAEAITVNGPQELADLLAGWLARSAQTTIADPGSYGGKAWVQINIAVLRAHLNADTTRAAVEAYLHHVQVHGPEAAWHVVANQRGRINKLLYGPPADDRAPGWYCYLATDRSIPGSL